MNPIPTSAQPSPMPDERQALPFSSPLPSSPGSRPNASHLPSQRVSVIYPLLLFTSTAVAAAFCFLYISKPFIMPTLPPLAIKAAAPVPVAQITVAPPVAPPVATAAQPPAALLPDADHLPGDSIAAKPPSRPEQASPRQAIPGGTTATAFEETNLRIQHVLTAETPGGDVSRIVLDVPVLYQTGTLAWSRADVAEARQLLKSLTTYQDQTRALRDEGTRLLAAWNRLVERAIPTPMLRADSPALPENQRADEDNPQPAAFDTAKSIQLQPTAK